MWVHTLGRYATMQPGTHRRTRMLPTKRSELMAVLSSIIVSNDVRPGLKTSGWKIAEDQVLGDAEKGPGLDFHDLLVIAAVLEEEHSATLNETWDPATTTIAEVLDDFVAATHV
jgi:hypothetical protein